MKLVELINTASEHLAEKGFDNARLEVEVLLGKVLGLSRLDLYMSFDRPVENDELEQFRGLYRRRLSGEPLQYIVGSTGFMDIELKTDGRAFIPRPETELLVELAVGFLKQRNEPLF
ncbi:MAG: protein-(glutamine-N5) methyltransferase, release factor-specific, partial [Candidatus Latescibacteria bacterium]|nr:protein-(glutamine-N5) methyltransferase, release factor-specific [Candidatus Latescibacterota bacterium]